MSIENLVAYASGIVQRQTARIRRRLRKNRNRLIFLVQNDDGVHKHFYSRRKAINFAARHGAWIYEGEQNANFIQANFVKGVCSGLTGIHWTPRCWFMSRRAS